MRLGMIVVLAAIAVAALIARGCSERSDGGATKVVTAGDAGAGDESQSAEFSLSNAPNGDASALIVRAK